MELKIGNEYFISNRFKRCFFEETIYEKEAKKVRCLRIWAFSYYKLNISNENEIKKLKKFSEENYSEKFHPLHEFDIIELEKSEEGQDEWQTLNGEIYIEDMFYDHLDMKEEDEDYEHRDLDFDEYVQDVLGFKEVDFNSFFESTPIDINEHISI